MAVNVLIPNRINLQTTVVTTFKIFELYFGEKGSDRN